MPQETTVSVNLNSPAIVNARVLALDDFIGNTDDGIFARFTNWEVHFVGDIKDELVKDSKYVLTENELTKLNEVWTKAIEIAADEEETLAWMDFIVRDA